MWGVHGSLATSAGGKKLRGKKQNRRQLETIPLSIKDAPK